jgi:hypothetical protein
VDLVKDSITICLQHSICQCGINSQVFAQACGKKYGDVLDQCFFVQSQEVGTLFHGKISQKPSHIVFVSRVFPQTMNICHQEYQLFGVGTIIFL